MMTELCNTLTFHGDTLNCNQSHTQATWNVWPGYEAELHTTPVL